MEDASDFLHQHLTTDELLAMSAEFARAQGLLQSRIGPISPILDDILEIIGKAGKADRAYLFMVRDAAFIQNTHEWSRPGVAPMRDELQQVPLSVGERVWSAMRCNGVFLCPDVSAMACGSEFRQILVDQHIQALILAPLWNGQALRGFIGLDYVCKTHHFNELEQNLIVGFAATLDLALRNEEKQSLNYRLSGDLETLRGRMAAMVAGLPELLVETDTRGIITAFHQSNPRSFDLQPEDVIGKPPEAIVPDSVARVVRVAMAEARESGWSETRSYSLHVEGERRRFGLHVSARRDRPDAPVSGFVHVVRDITQSYEQDNLIRRLVRVVEHTSNMIFLADAEGFITWMNPAAMDRTGVSLEQAAGKQPTDILRLGQSNPEVLDDICATLAGGAEVREEVRAIDKHGAPYWVSLNMRPLYGPDGRWEAFMVVATDITRHKLAEARAMRDRICVFDASRDGICISQADGRLTYMNPVLRAMLGVAQDTQIETHYWHDFTPDYFNEHVPRILPQLYATGHWDGEVVLSVPDLPERTLELSISVQDDASFLTISREVTARKQAEKDQALLREQLQIAQSRQLVAQLAGGLAHDVANVLSVVAHGAEALKRDATPLALENISRIEAATEQAQSLVRNLTRLDQRRQDRVALDLPQVLREGAALIRPSLAQGTSLTLTMPETGLQILGDKTSAMQVVLNLMLNARDALNSVRVGRKDQKGRISVRLSQAPVRDSIKQSDFGVILAGQPYALIEISDTGPGIAESQRDHILQPYFTTKGQKGSGLGLAIVGDILLQNDAALTVRSSPAAGTTMQVYWPLAPEDHVPSGAAPVTCSEPLAGMRVLLVDNDDAALMQLERMLAAAGAETASCIDPREAIAAVAAAPDEWDAVVTDHQMGAMTGIDLAFKLSAIRDSLPVILVTGGNRLYVSAFLGQSKVALTLRKPVSGSVLVSVLFDLKLRNALSTRKLDILDASTDRG